MKSISPQALRECLTDGQEFALVDVREEGVFLSGHLFWAVCIPLSHLEMRAWDLIPRRETRIVLCDGGGDGLTGPATDRLAAMGYTDVAVLEGGVDGWRDAGFEVFSGVNVPSKAFGEFVEHAYDTPRIPAEDLKALQDKGENLVILDSRPMSEYRRMNIPGGIDCPGAELVYRVHDAVPDPDTLVVVNCAGRTRSIIGAQSLINAGIPNRVMALKDGTMGWNLAGLDCAHGNETHAADPSDAGLGKAQAGAAAAAERFGVKTITAPELDEFLGDGSRSTYVLDVRTEAEYLAGHRPGSRHAPGGQLVQATDEYIGTRNARVVLVDGEQVRAVMTASWLIQLGWPEVYVLEEGLAGDLVSGPHAAARPDPPEVAEIDPKALAVIHTSEEAVAVIDLADSLEFRAGHVPKAWWAVRSRLADGLKQVPEADTVVVTSPDGALARYAAAEVAALCPDSMVMVLEGGTAAYARTGLPLEEGLDRATTETDDIWWKPYDRGDDITKAAVAYLDWEVALVEQMERDGTVSFRKFD